MLNTIEPHFEIPAKKEVILVEGQTALAYDNENKIISEIKGPPQGLFRFGVPSFYTLKVGTQEEVDEEIISKDLIRPESLDDPESTTND